MNYLCCYTDLFGRIDFKEITSKGGHFLHSVVDSVSKCLLCNSTLFILLAFIYFRNKFIIADISTYIVAVSTRWIEAYSEITSAPIFTIEKKKV
jgi:hypothetical protein